MKLTVGPVYRTRCNVDGPCDGHYDGSDCSDSGYVKIGWSVWWGNDRVGCLHPTKAGATRELDRALTTSGD